MARSFIGSIMFNKGEYSEKSRMCYAQNGQPKGYYYADRIKTPYYNHPQLLRFKVDGWKYFIGTYLYYIWEEARNRDYNFNKSKIQVFQKEFKEEMTVTRGQLKYEFLHLQKKLINRDIDKFTDNLCSVNTAGDYDYFKIKTNSLFRIVDGPIEDWEKIK